MFAMSDIGEGELENIFTFAKQLRDRCEIDSIILVGNIPKSGLEKVIFSDSETTVKIYRPVGLKRLIDMLISWFPFSSYIGLNISKTTLTKSLVIYYCDDTRIESGNQKYLSKRFSSLSRFARISIKIRNNNNFVPYRGVTQERVIVGSGVTGDLEIRGQTYIELSGSHIIPTVISPKLKVLAIVTVFNEEDIIGHTIKHLISEGLSVHLIDNWSTDSSLEIIKKAQNRWPNRVTFEQYPEEPSKEYNLDYMLAHVEDIAINSGADWAMHNDADEIRVSPWKGVKLIDAFGFVSSLGYNCLDFTVFNFMPTQDGYDGKIEPQIFFQYGDFGRRPGHFLQIKAWKIDGDRLVNLSRAGGHELSFPNRKIYPLKFFMKHYQLRSSEHAHRKIFKERLPRYAKRNRDRGWHVQYDNVPQEQSFISNPEDLICYDEKFDIEYMIPRLSGIGVKREEV